MPLQSCTNKGEEKRRISWLEVEHSETLLMFLLTVDVCSVCRVEPDLVRVCVCVDTYSRNTEAQSPNNYSSFCAHSQKLLSFSSAFPQRNRKHLC